MLIDYHKRPLAIGDTITNIESGWKGVIQAIEPDGMLRCHGLCFWDHEPDPSDPQWHAHTDVVKSQRVGGQL